MLRLHNISQALLHAFTLLDNLLHHVSYSLVQLSIVKVYLHHHGDDGYFLLGFIGISFEEVGQVRNHCKADSMQTVVVIFKGTVWSRLETTRTSILRHPICLEQLNAFFNIAKPILYVLWDRLRECRHGVTFLELKTIFSDSEPQWSQYFVSEDYLSVLTDIRNNQQRSDNLHVVKVLVLVFQESYGVLFRRVFEDSISVKNGPWKTTSEELYPLLLHLEGVKFIVNVILRDTLEELYYFSVLEFRVDFSLVKSQQVVNFRCISTSLRDVGLLERNLISMTEFPEDLLKALFINIDDRRLVS
jgi:hypothetical protein